jgi:hypothetical protein
MLITGSMSGETLMVKVGGLEDDATSSSDSDPKADEATERTSMEQDKNVGTKGTQEDQKNAQSNGQEDNADNPDGEAGIEDSDDDHSDTSSDSDSESEQQIFYVHKNVLCKTSVFLQNATKPEWTGPLPHPIDLTDENPKVFQAYLHWLYSRKVAAETRLANACGDASGYHLELHYNLLVKSYLLGEKLMDSTYQNAVMEAITYGAAIGCGFPGDECVRLVYKRTTASSPLRKLLVDFWVWMGFKKWIENGDVIKNTCKEFANDLIAALLEQREQPGDGSEDWPWVKNPEAYLVKDNEEASKVEKA